MTDEDELIDYLDQEAEIEIESAGEMTELGRQLRRMEVTARRLVNERRSLLADAEAAEAKLAAVGQGLKVKPLTWASPVSTLWYGRDNSGAAVYEIRGYDDCWQWHRLGLAGLPRERLQPRFSLEAAKEAAQADYERCIRGAFEPAPAPGGFATTDTEAGVYDEDAPDPVQEAARALLADLDRRGAQRSPRSAGNWSAVFDAMADKYFAEGWTDWPVILKAALDALAGDE